MQTEWLGFGKEELAIERQQLIDDGALLSDAMTRELENLLSE